MTRKPKTYAFTNSEGRVIRLSAKATIADLVKAGIWIDIGNEPTTPTRYIHNPRKP